MVPKAIILLLQQEILFVDKDDDKLLKAWDNIVGYDGKLLTNGGVIDLFLKCRKKFPTNTGLLDNMMWALGYLVNNNSDLRPKLMSSKLVEAIIKIAETEDATFSSHSAMEILVNFISDGKDTWSISNPSYDHVCSNLETTLEKWDVNTDITITLHYMGFENFTRLLGLPQCQRFALWSMASATRQTSMYLIYISIV